VAARRRAVQLFCTLVARQPLLLVLDDLHWAEPASLDFLRHFSRLAGLPILLVTPDRAAELTRCDLYVRGDRVRPHLRAFRARVSALQPA